MYWELLLEAIIVYKNYYYLHETIACKERLTLALKTQQCWHAIKQTNKFILGHICSLTLNFEIVKSVGFMAFLQLLGYSMLKSVFGFPSIYSGTLVVEYNLFKNWSNAVWVDLVSFLAMFGLPWQSFTYVLFSMAQLVCSNSEHLFDLWGIFYSNFLVELWIVWLESIDNRGFTVYSFHLHMIIINYKQL